MSERHARHALLAGFDDAAQAALEAASVAIVGVGGVGGPCATALAGAGVGRLSLIDDDRVSLSNLHRQSLFTTNDVGAQKVEIARDRLTALNPECRIAAQDARLAPDNAEALLTGHRLVVDGLDSFADRRLLARTCARLGVPVVSASAEGYEGRLTVFSHSSDTSASFDDLYPQVPSDLARGCDALGVLGPLAQAMGALAAAEVIKMLAYRDGAELGDVLTGKLFILDARHWRVRTVQYGPKTG